MAENTVNNDLSLEDLQAELAKLETDYRDLKFDHYTKGLSNPLELRDHRRDVARVKTAIRKHELSNLSEEELANRSKIRKRRRRQKNSKK
jgi:large subunit ribosomal protein L29